MYKPSLIDLINTSYSETEKHHQELSIHERLNLVLKKYDIDTLEELVYLLEDGNITIKRPKKRGATLKWTKEKRALLILEVSIVELKGISKREAFKKLADSSYWNAFIKPQDSAINADGFENLKKAYYVGNSDSEVVEIFDEIFEVFMSFESSHQQINYIVKLRKN